MKISNSIFIVLFSVIVCEILYFQPANTQESAEASIDFSLREQVTGPVFQVGEEGYQVIPRVYAVLEGVSNNLASTTLGGGASRLYGNYGPYQIFIVLDAGIVAPTENVLWVGIEERYQVALNINYDQPAIMTGQIVAHMLDPNASRAVADAYGLTIEAEFRDIGRVFFGTRPNQNVIELTELLNADIAVGLAEIDIIEEFYEPF